MKIINIILIIAAIAILIIVCPAESSAGSKLISNGEKIKSPEIIIATTSIIALICLVQRGVEKKGTKTKITKKYFYKQIKNK